MTVGWFMDDEPSPTFPIYTRGNVGEVFPDPVSPLTADHTWHGAGDVGMRDFMSRFTIDLDEVDDGHKVMFEIFGGYMYLNLSIARLMGARSSGMTPEMVDMGFFGSQSVLPPYQPRPKDDDPEITARVDGLMFSWMTATEFPALDEQVVAVDALVAARPDLGLCSEADLVARMREMPPVFARVFALHGEVSAAASVTMGAITALALGLGKPGYDLRIAGGLGGVASAAPSFAMWDLSRQVAASAELTAAFEAGVDGLHDRLVGLGDAAAGFLAGLDDLLLAHGSRGPNEWELRSPAWGTHPELVLALIDRMRLAGDDGDPRARHEAAAARAGEALEELRGMVAGSEEQAGTLEIANTASSVFIPAREQAKATIVKVIHEARLAALELGRRLATDGRLADAGQVFMLRDAELEHGRRRRHGDRTGPGRHRPGGPRRPRARRHPRGTHHRPVVDAAVRPGGWRDRRRGRHHEPRRHRQPRTRHPVRGVGDRCDDAHPRRGPGEGQRRHRHGDHPRHLTS